MNIKSEVRIYSHTNLIYWWPVWLHAIICFFATWLNHANINPNGEKSVMVYPSPWLGISFLCVLFFVIVFSNVKTRGLHAIIFLFVLATIAVGVDQLVGFNRVFDTAQLLAIYMNQAFYGVTAGFLFALWVVIVFGLDRTRWHRFVAGQVVEEHLFGYAPNVAFDTRGMSIRQQPSDFFRHKILGLGLLGLGTGDFICKPAAAGADPIFFENVVLLSTKLRNIERLITTMRSTKDS